MMMKSKNFFTENSLLQIKSFQSDKNEQILKDSLPVVLKELVPRTGKYQVVARLSFALLFGWYKEGKLYFSQNVEIDDQDVEEIRIFNATQEFLLQRRSTMYWCRTITDKPGNRDKTVDSTSHLFGKVISANNPEGFAELYEPGRKIRLKIPAEDGRLDEIYVITTRSYITKDKMTGQSGFGYYRYVGIYKEGREG